MSVLGKTWPDPVGIILNTRFQKFVSPTGIEGLARPSGDCLDVLAVVNPTEERGRFRAFIAASKLEYRTIRTFSIENRAIYDALLRYGFTPDVTIDEFGETQELLRWDRP